MLVLSRKIAENLVIGDDIVVTVLGIKGNQVRLGVQAPKNVRVDRQEIKEKKDNDPAYRWNGAR